VRAKSAKLLLSAATRLAAANILSKWCVLSVISPILIRESRLAWLRSTPIANPSGVAAPHAEEERRPIGGLRSPVPERMEDTAETSY
jgi:hypothetical protein